MRSIRVLFLRATPQDPWMNRAVSYLDPPFCHVEVEFDTPPVARDHLLGLMPAARATPVATSIYANETVFLRPRTFANPNYTILTIDVNDESFRAMYRFAEEKASQQTSFSPVAMLLSLFPLPCCTLPTRRTFCSAYITALLQAGNVPAVRGVSPARVRPSTLYGLLREATQSSFSSVPYKISLMDNVPLLHM